MRKSVFTLVFVACAVTACSDPHVPGGGGRSAASRAPEAASPRGGTSEGSVASGTATPASPAPTPDRSRAAGDVRVEQAQTVVLPHPQVGHLSVDGRWLGYLAGGASSAGTTTQAWLYDLQAHRDRLIAKTSYPHGQTGWIEVGRSQVLWEDMDRTPNDANHAVRWRIYLAPLSDPTRSLVLAESPSPQEFPPLPRLHGDTAAWALDDGVTARLVVASAAGNWKPRILAGEVRPDSVDVLDDQHIVVGDGDGHGHVNVKVVDLPTGRRRNLTTDGNSNFPRGNGALLAWEKIDGDYSKRTIQLSHLSVGGPAVTVAKDTLGNVVVGSSWVAFLTKNGLGVSGAAGRGAVDLPVPHLSVAARLSASRAELVYAVDPSPNLTALQAEVHVLSVTAP